MYHVIEVFTDLLQNIGEEDPVCSVVQPVPGGAGREMSTDITDINSQRGEEVTRRLGQPAVRYQSQKVGFITCFIILFNKLSVYIRHQP